MSSKSKKVGFKSKRDVSDSEGDEEIDKNNHLLKTGKNKIFKSGMTINAMR
jgi:hypothetical protein